MQKVMNSARGTSTPQPTGNHQHHHRTASTPVSIARPPGNQSRKGLCLAFSSTLSVPSYLMLAKHILITNYS